MIEYTVRVNANGSRFWYLNDKFHRVDGPAIECANGSRFWYLNGDLHQVDGPAIEYADGVRCWFLNGKKHRVDGPAVERADGDRYWYLNGIEYSEQEFLAKTAPKKEMTVAEIEKALGYSIKIVK